MNIRRAFSLTFSSCHAGLPGTFLKKAPVLLNNMHGIQLKEKKK